MEDLKMREEVLVKLGDDRKVLYCGTAENVKPFDETHKKGNLIRSIVLSVIGILLAVLYWVKVQSPSLVVAIVVLFIFLYGGFSEIINCSKFKKVKYYITEKHLITDYDTNICIIPLDTIDSYRYEKDADGHDYLLIGEDKFKPFSMRGKATSPVRFREDGKCESAVLYAMTDFDNFKKIFEQQLEKAQ